MVVEWSDVWEKGWLPDSRQAAPKPQENAHKNQPVDLNLHVDGNYVARE